MTVINKNIVLLLFTAMATLLVGCVEQRTYRLSDLFNANTQIETMDVYLAPFQPASWDKYDTLRRDPETNTQIEKSIRIKFLAEALIIAAVVPGAINADDELSLPPALLYEGLRIVKPELALPFLDYMSQNRQHFYRELNTEKRAQKNNKLHGMADTWLKNNGYAAGIEGLFQDMGKQPVDNLLNYHREFRSLPGGEKSTPWVVRN